MQLVFVSQRPLFRELMEVGLGLLPGVSAIRTEEEVRAALRPGTQPPSLLILDPWSMSEADRFYLEGACEVGGIAMILVVPEGLVGPDGAVTPLSLSDFRREILRLLGSQAADGYVPVPARYRTRRGRPRTMTNNLPLGAREYEIAVAVAQGYSNRQIAEQLNLREQTVKNVVSTILTKLECSTRVDLCRVVLGSSSE